MKKPYAKPVILFESFALSTNIAGDCDFYAHNPTEGVCGYPTRMGNLFIRGIVPDCKIGPIDDSGSGTGTGDDMICYHVPTEYTNLFNS